MKADLLGLAERLVLGPQAGAHLAERFGKDNQTLTPDLENLFLWGPLELYLGKGQLQTGSWCVKWVGKELAKWSLLRFWAVVSWTRTR